MSMSTSIAPMKIRRLYREIAQRLADQIADGTYKSGDRLPAERELALHFAVSRPTIREAMIALEMAGQIEIRNGAGIFVVARDKPARRDVLLDDIGPGPFELLEARAIFESEAAALAATRISDAELDELESICQEMSEATAKGLSGEAADQRFHEIIARATRNSTIEAAVIYIWALRVRMPLWGKLDQMITDLEGRPGWTNDDQTILDHRHILDALRARDPEGARQAMRRHLDHVRHDLLKVSKLDAVNVKDGDIKHPSLTGPHDKKVRIQPQKS